MARVSVLVLLFNGLLIGSAMPQYGPPGGSGPSAPPPPPPAPQPQSQPSYAAGGGAPPAPQPQSQPSYAAGGGAPPSAQSSFGGGSAAAAAPQPTSAGAGGPGGDLTVQCKASPDGSGKVKYDCSGANKDAITLKTEHILWLESQAQASQNLDIEIPNYNIDEFIKAAYKALGPQEGAKINILLKKPDVTYNAEKADAPKQDQQPPAVSLNYQPVEKVSVHYPSQKPYSNGGAGGNGSGPAPGGSGPAPGGFGPAPGVSGPAPNSASGGAYSSQGGAGAYSRPYRQSTGSRYYFARQ